MGEIINLVGMRFGRWKVLSRAEKDKNNVSRWLCECDCGNKRIVYGSGLRNGNSQSCGCKIKEKKTSHGLSKSRLYKIYRGMLDRCYNINTERFDNYGGRGIKVCEEWLKKESGFINFYNWAIENGHSDELSIDRIEVNKDYSPTNCKWSTNKEQANNRTNTLYITINGKTKPATHWEQEYNLPTSTIKNRFSRGWNEGDLLSPIVHKKSKYQSGVKGITWDEKRNKWVVRVKENKKSVNLGGYMELSDAISRLDLYKVGSSL